MCFQELSVLFGSSNKNVCLFKSAVSFCVIAAMADAAQDSNSEAARSHVAFQFLVSPLFLRGGYSSLPVIAPHFYCFDFSPPGSNRQLT